MKRWEYFSIPRAIARLRLGRFFTGTGALPLVGRLAGNADIAARDALPIVTLIAFLMGLILAYVGAVTLRPYGGLIFIANLVGLAMVREMAAMMTGVVMSGRTGAAFAAQLGTMKVSEEISALRVMGLSPIEYLVLPRMIALFLMFPLLDALHQFHRHVWRPHRGQDDGPEFFAIHTPVDRRGGFDEFLRRHDQEFCVWADCCGDGLPARDAMR